MDKDELELFKQAIRDGVSNRFDKMAAECSEEIAYSDRHMLAMQTIVYGKASKERSMSPRMRRIIAILIAAALLLTSCGIIFRNEIREIFEDFFVMVTYKEDNSQGSEIEDVYQLSYVPEGYYLESETITLLSARYRYKNNQGDYLRFEQRLLDSSDFYVDNEEGYSRINEVTDYEVYYRYTNENHVYVWNDNKYSIKLKSSVELPILEIRMILNGITTK